MSRTPLRIALYSGVIYEGDAISNSLLLKLRLIERLIAQGWDLEVTAFCHSSTVADPNIRGVRDVGSLLAEPAFQSADLHVFEFGVYYELFDVLPLIARDKRRLVVYHNVTPVELIDNPQTLAAMARTHRQKHNIAWADAVICASEVNCQDLGALGMPRDSMTTVALPPWTWSPSAPRSRRPADQPVEFLFLGRPVRAKGLLDLLEAVEALVSGGTTHFKVRIAGRLTFGEAQVVEAIRRAASRADFREVLVPEWDLPDGRLPALFDRADALVMPSYHEGYCVPVVEALGSQCHVISYDSSNLPAVGHGLTQLVPTGDVAALAEAMRQFVTDLTAARARTQPLVVRTSTGPYEEPEWRERAVGLAIQLRSGYEDRIIHLLLEAMRLVASPLASDKFGALV